VFPRGAGAPARVPGDRPRGAAPVLHPGASGRRVSRSQSRTRARGSIGLTVALCTLPWLGFVPDDVAGAPPVAVAHEGITKTGQRRSRGQRLPEAAIVVKRYGASRPVPDGAHQCGGRRVSRSPTGEGPPALAALIASCCQVCPVPRRRRTMTLLHPATDGGPMTIPSPFPSPEPLPPDPLPPDRREPPLPRPGPSPTDPSAPPPM